MRLKVLAFDYDGTLTVDGTLSDVTWAALERARSAGYVLLLVTGRILDRLPDRVRHADLFAAIVAENGAVVSFSARRSVALPFGRLPPALVEALMALDQPIERGLALVATWEPHSWAVEEVLRQAGGGAVIEFNKGAVMVLPPGATKGAGLQYALGELGYSLHNTLACGDAENDHSMFVMAEVAVAVANASASVQAQADAVMAGAADEGVRALIGALLGDSPMLALRSRVDRDLRLGVDAAGQAVAIPADLLVGGTLGIVGASRSGKSWLAGLVLEQISGLGYQCCVIDPEGDYRTLRALPHVLVLGGDESRLPDVVTVLTILEYTTVSVVLDFSLYAAGARDAYVAALLRGLRALRHARGRPHWILIDELQNLCQQEGGELAHELHLGAQEGGLAFVAYRPSQLPAALLSAAGNWLLTPLRLPEELATMAGVLTAQGQDAALCTVLPQLSRGDAVLCSVEADAVRCAAFRAVGRASAHVRHLHKYLLAPLPADKQFCFRDALGRACGQAASLWEFREALHMVATASLQFHLLRGDFEAWVSGVLRDEPLAGRLRKLAHAGLTGEVLRGQLVEVVDDRYAELERLT
ncbi:hypothetical protein HNQ07_002144 [Deinococcus metalli]|uniref:Phosphoglycolate phosphatase n=1 Tax=Deinococcus metalli TaxID=1141878 RepID=A0A7W8KEY6_9DEIO|nr:HAD hydrolase family protein [Deinococcus metalli]MBB5376680.1 hypothetical protein [Deinococcus metalli]GHF42273.1 phosphoglycolate phosphatase [Deinococcus metalli]